MNYLSALGITLPSSIAKIVKESNFSTIVSIITVVVRTKALTERDGFILQKVKYGCLALKNKLK